MNFSGGKSAHYQTIKEQRTEQCPAFLHLRENNYQTIKEQRTDLYNCSFSTKMYEPPGCTRKALDIYVRRVLLTAGRISHGVQYNRNN